MKTINDFKRSAEFFPAGRIIPQRILKGPRKFKSRVRFGSPTWAINTERGYVLAVDEQSGECAIRITKKIAKAQFCGSPYTRGGHSAFIGNHGLTDAEWLDRLVCAMSTEGGAA